MSKNIGILDPDGKNDNPLNNLPSGLQSLTISKYYNHPLNNLPASVKITRIIFLV